MNNTMNPYRRRRSSVPKADRNTIRLILNIARAVLIVLTAAILILNMFLTLNVGKERGNGVFGTKYFVISDAMMEPSYESGIIVGVREAAAYYAGDVIAFKSSSPDNYGSVTVRIIRAETTHNDRAAFITYPNATGIDDLSPAYAGDILGRVTSSHPMLGSMYSFLRSSGGYMVMVLLPFMLLILGEILRFILLKPQTAQPSPVQSQPQSTEGINRPRIINTASSAQRYATASTGTVMSDTAQRTAMSVTAQHKAMSDTAQHKAMSDTNLNLAIPKPTAKPAADTAQETTVWNKSDVAGTDPIAERPTMSNSPNPRRPVYTNPQASRRPVQTNTRRTTQQGGNTQAGNGSRTRYR